MKTYSLYIPLLILLLASFAGCQDTDVPDMGTPTTNGLHIALAIGGESPVYPNASSRATIKGESTLGENTVACVDFYLFNSDGTMVNGGHWRFTPTQTDTTTNYHTLYNGTDWIGNQVKAGSMLYAIANLNETEANQVSSLSTLKALAVTDESIYLKKTDGSKRFLMDGYYTFTEEDLSNYRATPGSIHQKTVDLRRAAAKIRVNISKGGGWAGASAEMGTITASIRNYAANTKVTADGTDLGKSLLLKDVAYSHNEPVKSYNRYEDTTAPTKYIGSLLFYTFAHNWQENSGQETSLEINVPYTDRPENYYKIVFLPDDDAQLKRNTFYEVNVEIRYDGSTESEEPKEIETKEWKVEEWKKISFDVNNNEGVDYLILSDYYIDLRNEDYTSITYYSSDAVTVETVGFASEEDLNRPINDNQATTIIQELKNAGFKGYEGHAYTGNITMDAIPGVYYVNKDNERIDITRDPKANYNTVEAKGYTSEAPNELPDTHEILVSYPSGQAVTGVIDLFSRIPRNVTPRYITLKVTMPTRNGQTLTRYAVVKQYPLEYIEGREGLYSYMDYKVYEKNNLGTFYKYVCPAPEGLVFGYYGGEALGENENDIFPDGGMVIPECIRTGTINGKETGGLNGTNYEDGNGRVGNNANMKCKFYIPYETGTDAWGINWSGYTQFATWEDAEGEHKGRIYRIDDSFSNSETEAKKDDNKPGIMDNGVANNNRMYEVVVTATSTQYRISRPLMEYGTNHDTIPETDETRMVAVSSEENNRLLSPRFMLASQLGNNSAVNYWETARDQCKSYVEVGRDGTVYNDWRLPTIAELEIVKNYQLDEDVYDITMNKILNSDGDTNPCYWTAGKDVYVNTTGAGQVAYQTYSIQITQTSFKDTTLANDQENTRITRVYKIPVEEWNSKDSDYQSEGYKKDLENENDLGSWTLVSTKEEKGKKPGKEQTAAGIYYTIEKEKKPDLAVRVRCVRDVKVSEIQ